MRIFEWGRLVLIVIVSTWVWAKSVGFTQHRSRKRRLRPPFLNARGACECTPKHALGAWCLFLGPNSPIFRCFRSSSSNNLPRNLRNIIPPIYKSLEASWIIILGFPKLSQFLRCSWFADLHDFFVNYFKNPLKLLCFGKTRITHSYIDNITKVLKS